MKILYIAFGGAIGSIARFLVSNAAHRFTNVSAFPLGTLTVNAVGSFLIGFLWSLDAANYISPGQRVFIFIGLLGGFTTFSSFSLETMNLIRSGEIAYSMFNILLSNIVCITLAFAGLFTARFFTH